MDFKKLMTGHSVIAIPMGIACVLAPATLLATYGLTLSPMGLVIYQFWGVALLGLGMLTWVFRNAAESRVRMESSLTLAVIHGINCVLAVRGQSAGANDLGWSTVALFLILGLAFAYIRFVKLVRDNSSEAGVV